MDLGWLYHGLGGAAITGVGVVLPLTFVESPAWWVPVIPFAMPPLLFAGGYLRERWQHKWEKMNAHRWWEAAAWGIGGLGAALLGLLWL